MGLEKFFFLFNINFMKIYIWVLKVSVFFKCLKQRTENIQDELCPLYSTIQTWKQITNWNENRINVHIRKLHIERKDDAGISAMKNYHSSIILFTSWKSRNKLQWRALALEIFSIPISLYREYIYTILDLRLIPEAKPRNCFQHNQTLTF